MRIGVDLLGIQSRESRGRGIGRYGRSLLQALLRHESDHQFILYAHADLPTEDVPQSPKAVLSILEPAPVADRPVQELVTGNPDELDVFLVLSPLELHREYNPPPRPLGGLAIASVIYDLIPFLFLEQYLTYPPTATRFYRNLERIRTYDALLGISEATAADARRLLGLGGDRVVVIGGASDPDFFHPDRSDPPSSAASDLFHRLGLDGSFIFCVASTDARKNLDGLLDGFLRLPTSLKSRHKVVVTCALTGPEADEARAKAAIRGLEDRLVLTGQIRDEDLRILYQRCAAFAFPSHYEGFGLPILEAMHCGAPVLAGKNSSQIEVAGDAAILVNTEDPADIALGLERLLSDPAWARRLADRGLERARGFHWGDVADRTLSALSDIRVNARRAHPGRSGRRVIRHSAERSLEETSRTRPRLAVVSPLPPKSTGVADYIVRLLPALRRHYTIDLYHDAGYQPDLSLVATPDCVFDLRVFPRRSRLLDYCGILYQMGNSYFHENIYNMMSDYPGIVTLHDINLVGFHFWRAHQDGRCPRAYFEKEIRRGEPKMAPSLVPWIWELGQEAGGIEWALVRRGVRLNRGVVERARSIIVHSSWALEQLCTTYPERAYDMAHVPHGADPVSVSFEHRMAMRERHSLPRDAMIVASFGILHSQKMNRETIDAFSAVAQEDPACMLVFVGAEHDGGAAREHARSLGIHHRVRFLGHCRDSDFADLLAVPDIGISLRRPPTNGETSGALLHLLRHGVPTIVTDVDAFSDYPASVVRKIRWPQDGIAGLTCALKELIHDVAKRSRLGAAASEYIRSNHAWSRVASRYAEVIDRTRANDRHRGHRHPLPESGSSIAEARGTTEMEHLGTR